MNYPLKRLEGPQFGSYFNLVVISEGYTSIQKNQFYQDVFTLWEGITSYYPFTKLKYANNSISLNAVFEPSTAAGYALTQNSAVGANNFHTYFDSGLNKLQMDLGLVDQFINLCVVNLKHETVDLKDYVFRDNLPYTPRSTLVLILLPSSTVLQAEVENINSTNYYNVASCLDGNIEQLVIRSFAKIIGLGDEFEGSYVPTIADGKDVNHVFPNLIYADQIGDLPSVSDDAFKWRHLFHSNALSNINVTPNLTVNSISQNEVSFGEIGFFEGGASTDKKIYRSALDCLLRREIGNDILSVKSKKVGLCPICEYSINSIL